MVAILDALEVRQVHVVAHDWGAGVAWAMALMVPERIDKLVVMSVGHPGTLASRTLEDREKAWYTLFFQFDEAVELLTRDGGALLRSWAASHPELDDALARFDLAAGLRWYRANMHPSRELHARASCRPWTSTRWGSGVPAMRT